MWRPQDAWLAAGVRTPFSRVDGALQALDPLELSVPVARHMAGMLKGGRPDFAVWGVVVPKVASCSSNPRKRRLCDQAFCSSTTDCLGRRDARELLPLPINHPDQVLLRVLRNDRADKRRQATDCQQRRSDYRPRYASPHWSLKTTSLRATRLTGPKRPTG